MGSGRWLFAGVIGLTDPRPAQLFDVNTGALRLLTDPELMGASVFCELEDGAVFVGGYQGHARESCVWSSAGALCTMPPVSWKAGVVRLPNGQLFVCGGYGPLGPTDAVFLFTPQTGECRDLGSMPIARWGHRVLSVEGQILVVGGQTSSDKGLMSIERFDLSSETWAVFNDKLTHSRGDRTALEDEPRVRVSQWQEAVSTRDGGVHLFVGRTCWLDSPDGRSVRFPGRRSVRFDVHSQRLVQVDELVDFTFFWGGASAVIEQPDGALLLVGWTPRRPGLIQLFDGEWRSAGCLPILGRPLGLSALSEGRALFWTTRGELWLYHPISGCKNDTGDQ